MNSFKAGERFAGSAAVFAGVGAFLYSVAFVVVQRSAPALGSFLNALFLTLVGLFATAAMLGVYRRVRETDPGLAAWGILLGIVGAIGLLAHGGYDLANAINPPSGLSPDLPSQVDPPRPVHLWPRRHRTTGHLLAHREGI